MSDKDFNAAGGQIIHPFLRTARIRDNHGDVLQFGELRERGYPELGVIGKNDAFLRTLQHFRDM